MELLSYVIFESGKACSPMASTIIILPVIPGEDSLEVLSVNEGLLLCSRNAA